MDRIARLLQQKEIVFLSVILVLAVVLRLIGFPKVPVSLYWDEMAIWNDALSIRATGLDLHARSWFQPLFISYGDYKLPVYIWLVSLVSFFTNDLFIAVRLPNFLAGISMVIGSFLLVRGILSRTDKIRTLASHFSAVVMAVIPWSLHFSTVGFEGHLSSAFLLWSMTSLVWSWRVKSAFWRVALFLSTAVFGILSVYSYFSTRFVWPVLFLGAVILWWKWARKWWLAYLCVGIVWGLALLPMLRADFYNESNKLRLSTENIFSITETQPDTINEWRIRSGNTIFSRVLYNRPVLLATELGKNVVKHFDPTFLFLRGDQKLRHGVVHQGLVYPVFAPFLVIGVLALWRKNWQVASWLSVWWLVSLVPASVPTDAPHTLRSLNALLPVVAFIGFGVTVVLEKLRALQLHASVYAVSLLLFLTVAGFQIAQYMVSKITVYPAVSAEEWQAGYLPLAEFISQERGSFSTIVVDDFDDRFFLYYQPYSGLSWQEIQAIPSEGFARQNLGNVTIQSWEELETTPLSSLVIMEAERNEAVPEDWAVYDRVYDELGKEAFVVYTTPRE